MTASVHHDQDFYSWAITQPQLLREGRLAEIDCRYVAEELEDMGAAKERVGESLGRVDGAFAEMDFPTGAARH